MHCARIWLLVGNAAPPSFSQVDIATLMGPSKLGESTFTLVLPIRATAVVIINALLRVSIYKRLRVVR